MVLKLKTGKVIELNGFEIAELKQMFFEIENYKEDEESFSFFGDVKSGTSGISELEDNGGII